MCGISGFYSLNQNFSREDLMRMSEQQKHRGPDADGIFIDDVCGLAHRRLSIIDLSEAANQPMTFNRYVMVYNGEVYNYREIARNFEKPLHTQSDSEVILRLFAQKNVEAVYQFNGMFAIAIYDRAEQALYLLRDRIGIKPLYYFWNGEQFAFASELKALQALPQLNLKVNRKAISDFLHLGYIPSNQSIYQNVYKLPAGAWLKLKGEDLIEKKYWNLPEKVYDTDTQSKLRMLNQEEEAKKQLRKLLESSINYRLISDVPLGVFLSGGIDSSTVTALAVQQSSQTVRTFSIGFEESKFNEAAYAKQVAQHLGTQHEELILSVERAKELIPKLLDIYDEPFADSSAVPTLLVSEMAKRQVSVALGGDGGDELFLGYGMYQWAERLQKPLWKSMRPALRGGFGLIKNARYQKAQQMLDYPDARNPFSHIFSQEQFFFSKRELRLLLKEAEDPQQYLHPDIERELSPMEKQAFFDLGAYLPDDLLTKVDRASMQHSLEARVPLLDHRIVEFALNLNPKLKYRKGESKYLLKQILYEFVPEKLFDRPKWGFSIPLGEWLQGDLRYLLEDTLSESNVSSCGIVDYSVVEKLKQQFFKGRTYLYNRLWVLMVLHQFMRKNKLSL